VSCHKCHSHMIGSHGVTSHDECGKTVHRPYSSCIISIENLTETLLIVNSDLECSNLAWMT